MASYSLRQVSVGDGLSALLLCEGGKPTKWRMVQRRSGPSSVIWCLMKDGRFRGRFESRDECYSVMRSLVLEERADDFLVDK